MAIPKGVQGAILNAVSVISVLVAIGAPILGAFVATDVSGRLQMARENAEAVGLNKRQLECSLLSLDLSDCVGSAGAWTGIQTPRECVGLREGLIEMLINSRLDTGEDFYSNLEGSDSLFNPAFVGTSGSFDLCTGAVTHWTWRGSARTRPVSARAPGLSVYA